MSVCTHDFGGGLTTISYSDNKTKRGVEFRHLTRKVSKIWRKVEKGVSHHQTPSCYMGINKAAFFLEYLWPKFKLNPLITQLSRHDKL